MAKPEYYALCKTGTTGPDVSLIQKWLNGVRSSFPSMVEVKVDGVFGNNTAKAVIEFQKNVGLKQDGKVGARTWNALYDKYAAVVDGNEQFPGMNLKAGQAGATVRSAQNQLSLRGFGVTADGIFGEKTTAAVKNYQTVNNIKSDGIIGQDTWSRLYT